WFATYALKPSQPAGACSQKTGEGLGIRKYFPDGQAPRVAIRSDTLGTLTMETPPDPNPNHHAESIGELVQTAPDASNMCSISSFDTAEQNVNGMDIAYEWSEVKFIVQANVPGTQVIASLRYTENGCSAEYTVAGMQPNVDCSVDSDCSAVNGVNPDF